MGADRTELLAGTPSVSCLLVNRRPPDEAQPDWAAALQAEIELRADEGLVPRPDLRGAYSGEWADRIADPHYADTPDYVTGHGVSAKWDLEGGRCRDIRTAWIGAADVEKTTAADAPGVELSMEVLGRLDARRAAAQPLGRLVERYRGWMEVRRRDVGHVEAGPPEGARRETAQQLLHYATLAHARLAEQCCGPCGRPLTPRGPSAGAQPSTISGSAGEPGPGHGRGDGRGRLTHQTGQLQSLGVHLLTTRLEPRHAAGGSGTNQPLQQVVLHLVHQALRPESSRRPTPLAGHAAALWLMTSAPRPRSRGSRVGPPAAGDPQHSGPRGPTGDKSRPRRAGALVDEPVEPATDESGAPLGRGRRRGRLLNGSRPATRRCARGTGPPKEEGRYEDVSRQAV